MANTGVSSKDAGNLLTMPTLNNDTSSSANKQSAVMNKFQKLMVKLGFKSERPPTKEDFARLQQDIDYKCSESHSHLEIAKSKMEQRIEKIEADIARLGEEVKRYMKAKNRARALFSLKKRKTLEKHLATSLEREFVIFKLAKGLEEQYSNHKISLAFAGYLSAMQTLVNGSVVDNLENLITSLEDVTDESIEVNQRINEMSDTFQRNNDPSSLDDDSLEEELKKMENEMLENDSGIQKRTIELPLYRPISKEEEAFARESLLKSLPPPPNYIPTSFDTSDSNNRNNNNNNNNIAPQLLVNQQRTPNNNRTISSTSRHAGRTLENEILESNM